MTLTYHSGRRLQGLSTDFQTSGLKAYWKMNESSGNLLNTASAQNSDSTMSADLVSSGTVNRGTAGHVSGVDSIGFPTYDADGNKVTANNSASDYGFMNKAAAKFTACWWAKNESHNSTVDLWGLGGNGNGADISFRNKSSGFTIWFSGTEYTSFTHNVGDNNWHFYMLSWDEDGGSDNAQFQLDGTKQTATITTSNTSDSASTLTIGDVSGNEPEMDIQEFSLWNRVLTDAEIALIYNSGNGAELQNTTIVGSKPNNVQVGSRLEETDTRKMYDFADVSTDGLKAYYKFDESSGNIINQATSVGSSDSLGTDADMTISGATYSQTGKIGNALSFDGSNDFGTLGSSLSQWNFFHGTGDWTLNYWINFGAFTSEAKIFSNLDSTETRGINVRVGGSDPDGTIGLSIKSDNGFMVNTGSISFNQTLSTGTWYMITLTCDQSLGSANYQVSVNGTGQGTANRSVLGSGNNAEYSTKIMRRGGASNGFVNADIDEMSIWNRLLTADEITSLYNSNSGRAISSGIFTQWKEIGT